MSSSFSPFVRPLIVGTGVAALRLAQAARELGLDGRRAEGEPDALVAAAHRLGCDALHPGEAVPARQLALLDACRAAGLPFLGQRAALLAEMAEGAPLRRRLLEAGLPVAPDGKGTAPVGVSLLADRAGRVVYLAPRQRREDGVVLSPLPWLTPERGVYLGRLAARAVEVLGATGLIEARFCLADNAVGLVSLAPGPVGEEALDEALFDLDPLVAQWRLWRGERLGERQSGLAPRGHARLWRLSPPPVARLDGGPGVRLDVADEGPARLVVWGRRPGELERRARRAFETLAGEDGDGIER